MYINRSSNLSLSQHNMHLSIAIRKYMIHQYDNRLVSINIIPDMYIDYISYFSDEWLLSPIDNLWWALQFCEGILTLGFAERYFLERREFFRFPMATTVDAKLWALWSGNIINFNIRHKFYSNFMIINYCINIINLI